MGGGRNNGSGRKIEQKDGRERDSKREMLGSEVYVEKSGRELLKVWGWWERFGVTLL